MERLWVKGVGRVEDAIARESRIEERLLSRLRHRDGPLPTWSVKELDHLIGREWTVVDRSPGQEREFVPLWGLVDPHIEEGYPETVPFGPDKGSNLGRS